MALKLAWTKRKNRSAGAQRWLRYSKLLRNGRLSDKEAKEMRASISPRRVGAYTETTAAQ